MFSDIIFDNFHLYNTKQNIYHRECGNCLICNLDFFQNMLHLSKHSELFTHVYVTHHRMLDYTDNYKTNENFMNTKMIQLWYKLTYSFLCKSLFTNSFYTKLNLFSVVAFSFCKNMRTLKLH